MSFSLHATSAQTFVRMLKNQRSWLAKGAAFAEQKKFDPSQFLAMRLAPDMLTFGHQIRISTDHAKGCTARLAQVDAPVFDDKETTYAEHDARLQRAIDFIASVPAEKMAGAETREIRFMGGKSERVFATGSEYLLTYALPNFYFHSTMVYALLRHNGVDVGKSDYLMGGAAL